MKNLVTVTFFLLSPLLFAYRATSESITPYSTAERYFVPIEENYIEWVPVPKKRVGLQPATAINYYENVERVIVDRVQEKRYLGTQVYLDNPTDFFVVPSNITANSFDGLIYAPNPYNSNSYNRYDFSCSGLTCHIPALDY